MINKASRATKLIAIICFVLIIVAVVTAWLSPATGYESSIYGSTPLIVWVCLLIAIACGISIIVNQLCLKNDNTNEWIIGLILILLSNAVIISLHIIRGYAFWTASGDPGEHIGWTRDIISTGYFEADNIYPMLHMFTAQISQVTDVNIMKLGQIWPVFCTLLGMGFVYYLSKSLMPDRRQVIATALVGTIMVGGWYLNFTPNHTGNMLFPLILYLAIKATRRQQLFQWRLLFIFVIFLVAILHILISFTLFFVISSISAAVIVWHLATNRNLKRYKTMLTFVVPLVLLLLVWNIVWISGFRAWDIAVSSIYNSLLGTGSSTLLSTLAQAEYAAGLGFDIRIYFLKVYSGFLIYTVLALVALPIIWKRLHDNAELENLFSLYGPLAMIAILFLINEIRHIEGFNRLMFYIEMFCIPFVGFLLWKFINASRHRLPQLLTPLLAVIFLFGLSAWAIPKIYISPYLESYSGHNTYTELESWDWFCQHRETNIEVTGFSIHPVRIGDFLFSQGGEVLYTDMPTMFTSLANHFGYDKESTLGSSYPADKYLVLKELDEAMYSEVYPSLAEIRFMPVDFAQLEHDPSLDKLYSNGGADNWFVHSMS